MYERVRSEEAGIDWHSQHGVGATLIDNRNNKNEITSGSLFTGPDSYSGFWIIEAESEAVAKQLAAEGSLACNRKVELRPYLR